ncbi:hypothetical protein ERHA55_15820 [Erwinia rhapontici]|nr:hypothetical protein [Erwinia rhapontici]BCQ44055.1 hypothetical protein ERHA55_15820 [Erwinia rhapontici]
MSEVIRESKTLFSGAASIPVPVWIAGIAIIATAASAYCCSLTSWG